MEHTRSIALVVGSGAPICGFVTSALHKHDIMFCLICSLSLSKLCIQCDVVYTICLNYVLCLFSFCAGTHSCTRGHTHLGVLALCVCVCVCLHPDLQPLVCCVCMCVCVCVCVCVPSSWFTAASMLCVCVCVCLHPGLQPLVCCVCVCVCLHPGLQPLAIVCCDGPSSLLKLFSSLAILIECSLDRWLLSCLT